MHLDVQFTRYRADNSVIGSFRSLWIVTKADGRWAVAARSSFADICMPAGCGRLNFVAAEQAGLVPHHVRLPSSLQ